LSSPGTPYLHSRHASSENLASLAAITDGTYVSPIALENRLQGLRVADSTVPSEEDNESGLAFGRSRRNSSSNQLNGEYFGFAESTNSNTQTRMGSYDPEYSGAPSGTTSQATSNFISRRTSEEEDGEQSGARTPFPQYDHMEDLAKVPSYATAVKTPAPRTPYEASTCLPTYGAVVREPSPPTVTEPPTAYIRSSPRVPGSLASSPPDVGLNGSRLQPSHRNVSFLQDEERRLRVLQMRGR